MIKDLNKLKIKEDNNKFVDLSNHNTKLERYTFDKVEAYFRNLENNLIEKIKRFKKGMIFGSIAWLTSFKILDALSECDNVQIVVQKEDFLRPDINIENKYTWKNQLREKYNKLKFSHMKYYLKEPICELDLCGDPYVDAIRCVGNHNRDKKPAFPRSHNKFLVFCTYEEDSRKAKGWNYLPVGVWTGSFNFTQNAGKSFENAIYLEDIEGQNPIINNFLQEHHQIYAISESLDWDSEWAEPEFRIGT